MSFLIFQKLILTSPFNVYIKGPVSDVTARVSENGGCPKPNGRVEICLENRYNEKTLQYSCMLTT